MVDVEKIIDDNYWLGVGYDLVDGAYARLLEQKKTISTFINALLTFYTIGTVITAIYMRITDEWMYLVIISPVLLIKGAEYFWSVFSLPEPRVFFPSNPDSCQRTADYYLNNLKKVISNMKVLAFFATFLTLSVYSYTTWVHVDELKKAEQYKNRIVPSLTSEFIKEYSIVTATCEIKPKTRASILISIYEKETKKILWNKTVVRTSTSKGIIYHSQKIPDSIDGDIKTSVVWENKDEVIEKSLTVYLEK